MILHRKAFRAFYDRGLIQAVHEGQGWGQRPAFDELWGTSRSRAGAARLRDARALAGRDCSPPSCERRQQAAEAAFRSLGITFAVYGEEEAAERIIPFDIIPRIFSAREWAQALRRARAAGAGDQRLHRRRLWRAQDPRRRRRPGRDRARQPAISASPCAGARPPHGIYAHICGIDLVRTGPDEFFVLEDNARTPSGVSYMLENREAMLRLCPELFDIFPVAAGRRLSRAAARHAAIGRAAGGARAALRRC